MAQRLKTADVEGLVGRVLMGKYRVEGILGYGASGVVAEATHLELGEKVAIKMLRRTVLDEHDTVQRFLREAQASIRLRSEHVARVMDVGKLEDGVPYMVMELLEGSDLDELLQARGTLPVADAVELLVQSAEALCEAHSLGIVHRDVKPSNIYVTHRPDGSHHVKLLDFGISKSAGGMDVRLTETQSLLGTPAYMSPEQMRSARTVDTRTDVWSLGVVLYEMLEGRRPFTADSFSEMCVKVSVDPPAAMTATPNKLQPVISKCLAKDPTDRYASMAELARDLVRFARDPREASALVEKMERTLGRQTPVSATEQVAAVEHRLPKWIWAAFAVFAVALGSGLGVWVANRDVDKVDFKLEIPKLPEVPKQQIQIEPIKVDPPKPAPIKKTKPKRKCNPFDNMDGCK